jgi:hypothetical protein
MGFPLVALLDTYWPEWHSRAEKGLAEDQISNLDEVQKPIFITALVMRAILSTTYLTDCTNSGGQYTTSSQETSRMGCR